MQRLKPCLLSSALLIAALPPLTADQPIMNMMPRWNGGYGVQMLADTIHRSDLNTASKCSQIQFTAVI